MKSQQKNTRQRKSQHQKVDNDKRHLRVVFLYLKGCVKMHGIELSDIMASISAILVATIGALATINFKRQKRREEINEQQMKLREEESRLSMKIMMATVALASATAIAIEQGKLNGEMKEAKEKAIDAQAAYGAFMAKIAVHEVNK